MEGRTGMNLHREPGVRKRCLADGAVTALVQPGEWDAVGAMAFGTGDQDAAIVC